MSDPSASQAVADPRGSGNLSPAGGAFVLRISPGGQDRVIEALQKDQIIIGWAQAELIAPHLEWEDFKSELQRAYGIYGPVSNQQAGAWTGIMWRFLRQMNNGDLVIVPYGPEFYIAEVTADATFEPSLVSDDTAYRRSCRWLNGKKPVPRASATAALQWRLKARQTCVDATDLRPDIVEVLNDAEKGVRRDFLTDLKASTLKTLRDPSSHINDWNFEHLVANLLKRLGASSVSITPRRTDKGDDIVARFKELGITIVAQVKYHPDVNWKTGAESLEQLLNGMEAQDADIGWLVSCGEFGFDTTAAETSAIASTTEPRTNSARSSRPGKPIRFIDGVQLAAMLVEVGAGPGLKDG